MKVTGVERSLSNCSESGWFGYELFLDEPVDEALIQALGTLGEMRCMRSLKRPFFMVHTDDFLVRGIVGDGFVRAGFRQKEAPDMALIRRTVETPRQ